MRWRLLFRVVGASLPRLVATAFVSGIEAGGAMADNEQAEGVDGAEAASSKKGKLKLIIAVAGFVAILGAGAGWFFLMRGHGEEKHAEAPPLKPPSFVEVPDMMVNLVGAPGERVQYLRVKVVLEIKEEKQVEAIKPNLPRVTDLFQTYLRELRPSDINGSAGLFRLKEELTKRVNNAVAPQQVSAVLFKEIVVQ
ncbi:flagellar FliL protein [Bradyrhizobium sp. AZCC 1577]